MVVRTCLPENSRTPPRCRRLPSSLPRDDDQRNGARQWGRSPRVCPDGSHGHYPDRGSWAAGGMPADRLANAG